MERPDCERTIAFLPALAILCCTLGFAAAASAQDQFPQQGMQPGMMQPLQGVQPGMMQPQQGMSPNMMQPQQGVSSGLGQQGMQPGMMPPPQAMSPGMMQPPQGMQPGMMQPPQGMPGFGQQAMQPPMSPGGNAAPPFQLQDGSGGGGQVGGPPQQTQPGGDQFARMAEWERQDFGVPPQTQLHAGAMHSATPNQIPGGQVITTQGLVSLVQQRQMPFLIFDVLGDVQKLPGAIPAAPASQPGSFNDDVQRQLGRYLQSVTNGNREVPLVFYCQGLQCWMSYNAALRAINLGYTNVLWYRGGIEAWMQAGLPTQPQ
jgi:PQQ-dependent catabolism-associated CXXCW motif protein